MARFARVYTSAVMALAVAIAVLPPFVGAGAWAFWFYNALVLLVIACPCALVISTPGSTKALAMDKTGTITMGEPEVVAVHPLGGVAERDLLSRAAARR